MDVKVAIITVQKEKEYMFIMNEKILNLSRDIENIKKNQINI